MRTAPGILAGLIGRRHAWRRHLAHWHSGLRNHLSGIAQAACRGVLIKKGMHLENLGTIKAIALDKTGTLTVGEPEATDVVPAADVTAGELLRIAAAVEQQSQHPLAAAVVRKAQAAGLPSTPRSR